eukprot:2262021-Pleurochrysis_carterae.AAC.1
MLDKFSFFCEDDLEADPVDDLEALFDALFDALVDALVDVLGDGCEVFGFFCVLKTTSDIETAP